MTRELKEGRKRLILSPSLRYEIETTDLEHGPGYWNYLRVVVTRLPAFANGSWTPRVVLATFERNYGTLYHSFFRFNGHEYFQSGRTYTSQLFVNLDTGAVHDTSIMDHVVPYGAPDKTRSQCLESCFCWASIAGCFGDVLVVEGCFWGGPYDYVCYDFSDPSRGPRYLPMEVSLSADCGDCSVCTGESGTFVYKQTRKYNDKHCAFAEKLTDDIFEDFYQKRTDGCTMSKERDRICFCWRDKDACEACVALDAECDRRCKEINAESVPVIVARYVLKRDGDKIVCLDAFERTESEEDEEQPEPSPVPGKIVE